MSGGYQEKWWTYKDVNCTENEMRRALGNHLSTEALMIGTDKQQTVAGKVRRISVAHNFVYLFVICFVFLTSTYNNRERMPKRASQSHFQLNLSEPKEANKWTKIKIH